MDVRIITRSVFLLTLGWLFLRGETTRAQTSAAGARHAALAGAAPSSDLWSEVNPAGWSQLGAFAAGVHVAELYELDELRLGAVQASVGAGETSVVAGVRTLGYDDYRETLFTTGAARAFYWGTHRPMHVGLRLRFHHAAARSYGSASAFAVSTGVVVPVARGTDLGLAAENLIIFKGSLKRELPRRLHIGLSISIESVTLLAAASKDVRTPLNTRAAVEVHLIELLALRAGYSLEPARFAGGFGLRLRPLTIDVAAERHFVLGWTPSCSVGVQW